MKVISGFLWLSEVLLGNKLLCREFFGVLSLLLVCLFWVALWYLAWMNNWVCFRGYRCYRRVLG